MPVPYLLCLNYAYCAYCTMPLMCTMYQSCCVSRHNSSSKPNFRQFCFTVKPMLILPCVEKNSFTCSSVTVNGCVTIHNYFHAFLIKWFIAWFIATCSEIHWNVQNLVLKIFATFCKRLVSKVSCLVSVSARSSLGLVSTCR